MRSILKQVFVIGKFKVKTFIIKNSLKYAYKESTRIIKPLYRTWGHE